MNDIEFDELKNAANRAKHGIGLSEASRFELATAAIRLDTRRDYGEQRFRAIGFVEGRLYVLAFTMRGRILRAISLRQANRREIAEYDEGQ